MKFKYFILIIFIQIIIFNVTVSVNADERCLKYRLPGDVIPIHYALNLSPHIFGNFTFDGVTEITAKVTRNTAEIVLHIDNLLYTEIYLKFNGQNLPIKITHDKEFQLLRINTYQYIATGSILLITIAYTGRINEEKVGLYRNRYRDNLNQIRWFVATNLEPIGARKVFPCFDEPAMRATFQLNISRTSEYKSVSVSKLKYTAKENAYRYLDIFETTPNIPPYAVAFALSSFQSADEMMNQFNWTNNRQNWDMVQSIDTYKNIKLRDFEEFWRYKNQLENWGVVVYDIKGVDNTTMIINPNYASLLLKQKIARQIISANAFRFNGIDISPHWWKNVWLTTGLAHYLASVETKIESGSSWIAENQFTVDELQPSFLIDALPSAVPISHEVCKSTEIINNFNGNSRKSASIIRMIIHSYLMDRRVYSNAITHYGNANFRKSATPDDLYKACENEINFIREMYPNSRAPNVSIEKIMDSWMSNPGFPIVHVNIDNGIATLRQERFLYNDRDKIPSKKLWWIPITWTSNKNNNFNYLMPTHWLTKSTDWIKVDEINDNGWIIFNIQEVGYYRVNYDKKSWSRIIKVLKSENFKIIHEINRAALLDDLFNLAKAGYVDYDTVLSATEYLKNETSYIAWKAAFNNFEILDKETTDEQMRNLLKIHILGIIDAVYDKINFEDDKKQDFFEILLKSGIIKWACKYRHHDCVGNSLRLFDDWKRNSSKFLPVNLRDTIACTAIENGPDDNWDFLRIKYLETDVQSEKNDILKGLSCTKNRDKLHELLSTTIDDKSPLKFEDRLGTISSVSSSGPFGVLEIITFIAQNLGKFIDFFKNDDNVLENIFKDILDHLTIKSAVEQFQELITNNSRILGSIQDILTPDITEVHNKLKLHDFHRPAVDKYLNDSYFDYVHHISKYIQPSTYVVYLNPDFTTNFTFNGTVEIRLNVLRNISSIILHAADLNVTDIKIAYAYTLQPVDIIKHEFNSNNHLVIYLKYLIPIGSLLSLSISYTGILHNETSVDILGVTELQKTASQVFPCFDEPEFTSRFQINIHHSYHSRKFGNLKLLTPKLPTISNEILDIYEESEPIASKNIIFIVTSANRNDTLKGTTEIYSNSPQSENIRTQDSTTESAPIISTLSTNNSSTTYSIHSTTKTTKFPELSDIATASTSAFDFNSTTNSINNSGTTTTVITSAITESDKNSDFRFPTTESTEISLNFNGNSSAPNHSTIDSENHLNATEYAITESGWFQPNFNNTLSGDVLTKVPNSRSTEHNKNIDRNVTTESTLLNGAIIDHSPQNTPNCESNYTENSLFKMTDDDWYFETTVPPSSSNYSLFNRALVRYLEWLSMIDQVSGKFGDVFITQKIQRALLKNSYVAVDILYTETADLCDSGKNDTPDDEKLASVFHMMQHAFGKQIFNTAIVEYFKKHGKNVIHPFDFWSVIKAKVHDNKIEIDATMENLFMSVINTWINQSGYPVVHVSRSGTVLTLRQERFLMPKSSVSCDEVYALPITVATQSNCDFTNTSTALWLQDREISADNLDVSDGWFILNIQHTGFYRANYDLENWKKLLEALRNENFNGISEINRAQIMNDLLNLARSDYISYDLALNGTEYLSRENSYLPWKVFFNGVSYIYERFKHDEDASKPLRKYILVLIQSSYDRVEFNEEIDECLENKLKRHLIVRWACKIGYINCVRRSKQLFNQWRQNSSIFISPEVRQTVLCTAIKYGSDNDWQFLLEKYIKSISESDKLIILRSLGCSKNQTILNSYLDFAIFNSSISKKNIRTVFSSVHSPGKIGVDVTLKYLKRNYKKLHEFFGDWDPVAELFSDMASKISLTNQISELNRFALTNKEKLSNIIKSLNESILSAAENSNWYNNHVDDIKRWLIDKTNTSVPFLTHDDDKINERNLEDSKGTHKFAITNSKLTIAVLAIIIVFLTVFVASQYFYFKNRKTIVLNNGKKYTELPMAEF